MENLKSYSYRFQLFISELLYCIIVIDTIYYLLTVCGWLYINVTFNVKKCKRNINSYSILLKTYKIFTNKF